LLAHELTHTLQQGSHPGSHLRVQRKVRVEAPTDVPKGAPPTETNASIIKRYVTTLCPTFTVAGEKVVPSSGGACAAPTTESCRCLCGMHNLKNAAGADVDWKIQVNDDVWPQTSPGSKTVYVPSGHSGLKFGEWTGGPLPHRKTLQNWLVLGHELCGHGWLGEQGKDTTSTTPEAHGGRPGHDPTVIEENKIAAEHGIPTSERRGLFKDPHHGESFVIVTVSNFAFSGSHKD
jgi:hypothetical protein